MIASRGTTADGAAIIIVLAFVVLLATIVLAYLTHTTIGRQIAHGDFNDAKSDELARSALDIVVADFKQEITNGSPVTSANIGPQRNVIPVAGTTPAIPNLIRRSIRSDGIAAPAVPSGASAVNSADDPSSNGRFVSLARWNSHYLVPKMNTGDDKSDPVPAFLAPDWVLVSRNGPMIQTAIGTGPSAINDSSNGNSNYVIGRYAYAIYDEGGLLDFNIAGYPYPSPSPVSTPLNLATAVGRKGTIALADLTAMKLTTAGATASQPSLTRMIAWRNYATVQAAGLFPNLSPSDQSEVPYLNYVLGSPAVGTSEGFLTVAGALFNGRTNQAFLNRRQLIELFGSLNGSFNMLQYLGTFSRERNVPTWTAGTAVLNQRFYIGNLGAVVPNPSAAQSADIQKFFGLRWVAASLGSAGPPITPATPGHWQYVGSSGIAMRDRIPGFTTSPEFFQLLNYAMNGTNSDDSAHVITTLSIGAALIDQYDDSTLADPVTGTTTTMIEYNGGWAMGLENIDPARPSPSPQPSPFPGPFGMSPTPSPFVANYAMLNRPFRSVGEFGYAFRASAGPTATPAIPKTIDFANATSTDAPILDLFTYNSASLRAGSVNLNTQNIAVIAAIVKSAVTNESTSAVVGLAASNNAAASPTQFPTLGTVGDPVNGTMMRPAIGRQDIVRLVSAAGNTIGSTEEAKETVARALSEVTQTRTWVLMIDLVAQSGRYPPNAATLANFVVEGERRYWLHVAIDRFTGEVIDQQLEAVYE
jgi:hypothetical protein